VPPRIPRPCPGRYQPEPPHRRRRRGVADQVAGTIPFRSGTENWKTWANNAARLGEREASQLFIIRWIDGQPRTEDTLNTLQFHLAQEPRRAGDRRHSPPTRRRRQRGAPHRTNDVDADKRRRTLEGFPDPHPLTNFFIEGSHESVLGWAGIRWRLRVVGGSLSG
jgi:hypothetical protein